MQMLTAISISRPLGRSAMPVRPYKNPVGKLVDQTEGWGLAVHRGWWNGITGRDIDTDQVATNFGAPDPNELVLLYYGNMGGRAGVEIRIVVV